MDRHAFVRIMHIDKLIRENIFPNCPYMADRFEVSERTILRDIEALKDSLGAPVRYSRKRRGYYYEKEYQLPEVKFSEGEMIALLLSEKILSQFKNTPFQASMDSLFEKLNLFLPDEVQFNPTQVSSYFSFENVREATMDDRVLEIFQCLVSAIRDRRRVDMVYRTMSRDDVQQRMLDPYHMRYAYGTWYVVGFCHMRQAVRTFGVRYIREIEVRDETFLIPETFQADEYFGNTWGIRTGKRYTVILEFTPYIARWVEQKEWHPTQRLQKNPDGSATMEVSVAGLEEILWWVLGFGVHVRVIEPSELRALITEELEGMLTHYS